jgi:iron complex outermembrane receptor protein
LAVRYENYGGTIVDSTTPKIGVRWQALESLTVRSSFSQSFRAPNTGVIFSGVGFDGNIANDFLHKDDVRAGILPPIEANAEVRGIFNLASHRRWWALSKLTRSTWVSFATRFLLKV